MKAVVTPLRVSVLLSIAAATSLSGAANAADAKPGVYVLGGAGLARVESNYENQVRTAYIDGHPLIFQSATLKDKSATAYQLGVGYQFMPAVAVELNYLDLGRYQSNYAVRQGSAVFTSVNAQYRMSGLNLSAVGSLSISPQFSLLAKIGAFQSTLKYSEEGSNTVGIRYSFANTDRQTKLSYGLGGEFAVNNQFSVRANWDRLEKVGRVFALTDNANGRFDYIDVLTVNALYRF